MHSSEAPSVGCWCCCLLAGHICLSICAAGLPSSVTCVLLPSPFSPMPLVDAGLDNIREVIPFPRWPGNAAY